MAIKASNLVQPIRSATCLLIVPNDDGDGVHEEEVRFSYYSPSIQWWREHGTKDEGVHRDLAVQLSEFIHELTDIHGDDGNPQAPTVEFFSSMMSSNLKRINEAIGADLDPGKKSLPKSLPDTSKPEDEKESQ